MHIRDKFDYVEGNELEARDCVDRWREALDDEMPKELKSRIRRMPDHKMLKLMDMMKVRMRYMKDIKNHVYFFKDPDYDTDLGRKFIKKLKQAALTNKKILADLYDIMSTLPEAEEEFTALALNKSCSIYLYE